MGCAVSKRLKTELQKKENRPIRESTFVVRTETQPSSSKPITDSQKNWCLQEIEKWRQEREESYTPPSQTFEWVMDKMDDGDKIGVKEEVKEEVKEDFVKRVNLDKEKRKRMVIKDDTILELPTRMPTVSFDE